MNKNYVNDHRALPKAAIWPARKGTDLKFVPDYASASCLPLSAGLCGRPRRWLSGLLCALLLLSAACATRPPVGEELTGRELRGVKEAFLATMEQRRQAVRCLDAEVDINWRTLLRSGIIPGYLQAMAPGRLKFVGVDPLGRPALVLVTDGESFRLIMVGEGMAYQGPTTAEAFRRHLPEGLDPERLPSSLFAWVSGGMPLEPEVVAVYREHQGPGYWLEVADPPGARLLFEPLAEADVPVTAAVRSWDQTPILQPPKLVSDSNFGPNLDNVDAVPALAGGGVLRRIQLFEPDQRRPTEIIYDDYRPVTSAANDAGWLMPHRIELDSRQHRGLSLTMVLADLLADCVLGEDDFQLSIPPGFTLETVQ